MSVKLPSDDHSGAITLHCSQKYNEIIKKEKKTLPWNGEVDIVQSPDSGMSPAK